MGVPNPQERPDRGPRSALRRLGPAGLYATYVFVMGSLPDVSPPMHTSDKVAHAVVFGLMVPFVLPAISFFRATLSWGRRVALACVVVSAAGGLLEVWQMLLPYRRAELLDWVADTAGAVGAAALLGLGRALLRVRSRA